ncbi:MAG TPA: ferrous iron transport protein A [Epsilonproteobacteria bacterium]|nr:ferrous iron transport protein A [Campylobacterota bacterium]
MKLTQLQKNQTAKVVGIDGPKSLRERLFSFGILPQEEIILKEYSLAKQTLEVLVGDTLVALRANEAMLIEIEII